jgi:Reverse transcriptase (RNA-dependent DNA polymerase)
MKQAEKEAFMNWYLPTNDNGRGIFNFQEQMYKCCKLAVEILRKGCFIYRDLINNVASNDPFQRITIATETAVLSVYNDLVRATDNGQVSLLLLLDRNAAFDTVDHSILLPVLSHRFSVVDTAFNWFQSYLSGRTQSFVYAGQQTSSFPVYCSVPQGSVLGPQEIITYTEDITGVLS